MTDMTNVNISGLDGVEEWASEVTAGKILKQLEAMFKMGKEEQRKMKKLMAELGTDRKVVKKTVEDASRAARRNAGAPKGTGTSKKDDGLLGKLKNPKSMFNTMTTGLGDFGRSVTDSSKHLQGFSKHLHLSTNALKKGFGLAAIGGIFAMLGRVIGTAITNVEKNVEVLSALNDVGIRVEGSWVGLMNIAADTGISLEKMQQVAEQYSATVGLFGLTRIRDFALQANSAAGGLSKFGVSLADAVEFQTEYLEQQRLSGVFERYNSAVQGKALAENIARLTEYSKALGVSRKKMLDSSKAMMGAAEIQRRLANMNEADRKKASEGFTNLSQAMTAMGPGMEPFLAMVQDMASYDTGMESASKSMQELMKGGYSEVAFALQSIKRDAEQGMILSTEEIQRRIEQALPPGTTMNALAMNDSFRELTNQVGAAKMGFLQLAEQQKVNEERAKALNMSYKEYMQTVDANTAAMTELDNAVNKLKARWGLLLTKGIMDIFGGILEGMGFTGLRGVIEGAANGIDAFGAWMQGLANSDTFGNIGKSIGESIKAMRDFWNSLETDEDGKQRSFIEKLGRFLWGGLKTVLGWAVGGIIDIIKWLGNSLIKLFNDKFKFFDSEAEDIQEDIDAKKRRLNYVNAKTGFGLSDAEKEGIRREIAILEKKKVEAEARELAKYTGAPGELAQDVMNVGKQNMEGKKVATPAQSATPKAAPVPSVQTPQNEPAKAKKDEIADILKTGTGDQLDMLDDIRQLMAMSTRSLETIAKRMGQPGALLQG